LAEVQSTLADGLETLAAAFESMETPADLGPRIDATVAHWDTALVQLRTALIARGNEPSAVIPALGQAARYRATLLLLRRALDQARQLKLADYLGDVAL
jgi:hypothetical protein